MRGSSSGSSNRWTGHGSRAAAGPFLAAVAAILTASLFGVFGDAGALAAKKPNPTTQALRALVRQTNALPGTVASTVRRRQLRRAAAHALRVARKQPCVAVRDLVRYRRVLARVKVKRGKRLPRSSHRLAALGPASVRASRLLLADTRTRRCGGGVKPSRRATAKATVLSSDVNGMRLRVELPELRFVPRIGGGRNWTQLVLPNTDAPGAPGTPGIPVVSSVFGVPEGAKVVLRSVKTQSYSLDGVDVFPAQPDPVDADRPRPNFDKPPFAAKPFTIDSSAYRANGPIPAKPAAGGILGTSRDIAIGDLRIPAAQYEPRSRELKVLTSVQLDVRFEGGPHTFSQELASPWEHAQRTFAATLLNREVIRRAIRELPRLRCGEEMLVITNPATRPAADTFATARRAAGIRTTVVETGTGTGQIGTTPAEIQSFIRSRLTQLLCIRPSYVTILGDDDLVPTFPGINGIPSDLQYSMRDDADELPDLAVGRIIGNDQAAVGTAVAKIVAYETSPPAGVWLNRSTIAAQFQDDDANGQENRTFIQFAETVRKGLVARFGVGADRIYGEHPGDDPQKFNDGTDLPAALKKPTFAWNGTGADVTAAWNQGRFLVVHRDHGYSDGWGTPGYHTANVTALTNGAMLPVVMSINCSSAAYDYDETSFVGEALVNPNGGAVGAFGDTRDSPSWHNTQIALGFVDALVPRVLPAEGPALKQRVGNALIHGKLRLAGLAPPSGPGITGGDGSTRNELYLWHYFGDPSMQMWGGEGIDPPVVDKALINAVFALPQPGPDPPPYVVVVSLPAQFAGQPVSLLREGQVVGKAVAGAGSVTIPASFGDGAVKPGDLRVAMEADGTVPVNVPVSGVPKAATTLTQTCPKSISTNGGPPFEVKGKLQPGFAGAAVRLVYRRPDASTFTKTTTTDANGDWTLTIDPVAESSGHQVFGNWTVQSNFDGNDAYTASQSTTCTVVVND